MIFRRFWLRVTFRVTLIFTTLLVTVWAAAEASRYLTAAFFFAAAVWQLVSLVRYVSQTNRRLAQFIESIRYEDFVVGFQGGSAQGKTFSELNAAFRSIVEDFQKARAQNEETLRFLNTIVQHVGTGLLAYDQHGHVHLYNNAARRKIEVPLLRNLRQLETEAPALLAALRRLRPGQKTLVSGSSGRQRQLSLHATEFRVRGTHYQIISLQDIRPELEAKELEAWQNLTRVLRHEIMNSITPIASLSGTLQQLVEDDLKPAALPESVGGSVEDLACGLATIARRSQGLLDFVDAYRAYTSLPKPEKTWFSLRDCFERMRRLVQELPGSDSVTLSIHVDPLNLELNADVGQVEMVVLNLLKNAVESLDGQAGGLVRITAAPMSHGGVLIQVTDNGPGIEAAALERIFIPFYTTKKGGSGVGLSWSRQVLQQHGGTLSVESTPGEQTTFALAFG